MTAKKKKKRRSQHNNHYHQLDVRLVQTGAVPYTDKLTKATVELAKDITTPPRFLASLASMRRAGKLAQSVRAHAHMNPNLQEDVLRALLASGVPTAWLNPNAELTLLFMPRQEVISGARVALFALQRLMVDGTIPKRPKTRQGKQYTDLVEQRQASLVRQWWQHEANPLEMVWEAHRWGLLHDPAMRQAFHDLHERWLAESIVELPVEMQAQAREVIEGRCKQLRSDKSLPSGEVVYYQAQEFPLPLRAELLKIPRWRGLMLERIKMFSLYSIVDGRIAWLERSNSLSAHINDDGIAEFDCFADGYPNRRKEYTSPTLRENCDRTARELLAVFGEFPLRLGWNVG